MDNYLTKPVMTTGTSWSSAFPTLLPGLGLDAVSSRVVWRLGASLQASTSSGVGGMGQVQTNSLDSTSPSSRTLWQSGRGTTTLRKRSTLDKEKYKMDCLQKKKGAPRSVIELSSVLTEIKSLKKSRCGEPFLQSQYSGAWVR